MPATVTAGRSICTNQRTMRPNQSGGTKKTHTSNAAAVVTMNSVRRRNCIGKAAVGCRAGVGKVVGTLCVLFLRVTADGVCLLLGNLLIEMAAFADGPQQ